MKCVLKTSLKRTPLVRGVDANTVARPVRPVWSGGREGSVLHAYLLRLLSPDPLSSPVSAVTLVFCHMEVNLPPSHCSLFLSPFLSVSLFPCLFFSHPFCPAPGDNMLTAVSVARDCGMIAPHERVIIAAAAPPRDPQPARISWQYTEDCEQLAHKDSQDRKSTRLNSSH